MSRIRRPTVACCAASFRRLAASLAALACAAHVAGEVPPRGPSGQTLVVPERWLDAGDIYHVMPGDDAQLVVTSDAPLQRSISRNCRVVGFLVLPIDSASAPLLAGALRIPAASFESGNRERDDFVAGPAALDADNHAELTFEFESVRDVTPDAVAPPASADKPGLAGGSATAGTAPVPVPGGATPPPKAPPKSFRLTLVGKLTCKGRTIDLDVPARLTLRPFTFTTMQRFPGELVTLSADLRVRLADLGIERPARTHGERIAEECSVSLFLLANTVAPDKTLDPAYPDPQYARVLQYLTRARDLRQELQAAEYGHAFVKESWADAAMLTRLGEAILSAEGIRPRDTVLAIRALARAAELRPDDVDAALLLAQAHAERGDYGAALPVGERALALLEKQASATPAAQSAPAAGPIASVQKLLERYRARQALTRQP